MRRSASTTIARMARVFVTRRLVGDALDRLAAAGHDVDVWEERLPPAPERLAERARVADALLCTLEDRIDAALLDACPRLRVVANHATGTDNVDLAAAARHGVAVTNTPDVLTDATADLALALLLAAAAPAFADIALPKKPGADPNEVRRDLPTARMVIERVEGLREARLQIPRSRLQEMGLAAGIDTGGGQAASLRSAGTIIGGIFISLAVILTGLLLVRSRRGLRVGRVATAVALCVCAAGAAAVAAYANVAPPPGLRPQDPGTLVRAVSGAPLAGSIRVEVVDEGYEIKLLVPAKPRSNKGDEEE